MTGQLYIELQGTYSRRAWSKSIVKYYPDVFLKGLKGTIKILSGQALSKP